MGRLYLCFDRNAIINNQMPGVTCDKNCQGLTAVFSPPNRSTSFTPILFISQEKDKYRILFTNEKHFQKI
jgi:hypothetical protein